MLGRGSRCALGLAVAAALSLGVGAGPAWALDGTTFDATDGNLVLDAGEPDWESFADSINCDPDELAGCAIDKPTGSGDDAFGGGAKDDKQTVEVVSGSVPNNKSDLKRAYATSETVDGNTLLYLAWVRGNTLGTANFSIELNQVAQEDLPTPGVSYTFDRRPGDLLVLYDWSSAGKADKVQLRLSKWVESGDPKQVCEANSTVPCWGEATLLDPAVAEASVNEVAVTDPLYPEPDGQTQLEERTFGEAAIDLTAAGVAVGACETFGSALFRSRSSDSFNAELKDFIARAPIAVDAEAEVSEWKSNGEAMTLGVYDTELGLGTDNGDGTITHQTEFSVGETTISAPRASSSKTGEGTDEAPDPDDPDPEKPNPAASIDVPTMDEPSDGDPLTTEAKKGDVLHGELLAASAKSVVDADPAITTQSSAATIAGLNINKGTVTADVVKSLAMTDATENDANPTTRFSGIKNLKIDVDGDPATLAVPISNDVAPNTKIVLDPIHFGKDSFVEIRREEVTTDFPPPGTPLGTEEKFAADVVEITGLHVHITDRTPDTLLRDDGEVTLDVVIAKATAHSEAYGILCNAVQAVEGHATVLRGNVGDLAGATIGHVAIPTGGGASDQELDGFELGDPPLAQLGISQSHSDGSWSSSETTARSFAHVVDLCVDLEPELPDKAKACEISADTIKSNVESTAAETSTGSTGSASFVNLEILGEEVDPTPGTLEEIPGVGLVAIDEHTCGAETPNGNTCTSADGTKTAMTVRALHIVVTEPPSTNGLGLALGSELVIAEAHSGATFVAAPVP